MTSGSRVSVKEIKGAGETPFGCAQDKPALRTADILQDKERGVSVDAGRRVSGRSMLRPYGFD
jgi:hypothetical protein